MTELERQVRAFVEKTPDDFDSIVKTLSGVGGNRYRLEHSDGTSELAETIHSVLGDAAANAALSNHFSQMYRRTICLGNICCSSHQVSDGTLTAAEQYEIQIAAVRTDPSNPRG
jgi:hypothetical protein